MRNFIDLIEQSNIVTRKASSSSMEEFFRKTEDFLENTVFAYKKSTSPMMPWKIVPANRLIRIWQSSATDGFIRDERGMDAIADQFYKNIVQLCVNTEIAEHGPRSKEEILDEYFDTSEEMTEFVDWAITTEKGGWRISDYGLEPLINYAGLLHDAETAEDKMLVCDAILNVVHQRSDLASWFVEGGSAILDQLANN